MERQLFSHLQGANFYLNELELEMKNRDTDLVIAA